MAELLLTILPPWGRPTLPIGLGYLSQFLDEHGWDHEVLDLNLQIYHRLGEEHHGLWRPQRGAEWVHPDKLPRLLEQLEPQVAFAVDQLAASSAPLIGFSINQSNAGISTEVARRLKERDPERIIIFGGLGIYIHGERRCIPDGVVDLFVMGEGEVTLLRILERRRDGLPIRGTTGTLDRPGADAWVPRPPVVLRAHPWPRYGRFDVKRYPAGGQPFPLGLSRGCVCRCSFCGDYPFWGRYRCRRGQDLLDEIRHHVQHYGVRTFEFNDLAINGDPHELEVMCEGIVAEKLDIEWSSYAYVSPMPEDLVRKIRDSGCVMLRFGMESASDSVLKRMRKPHRSQRAAELLAQLTQAGIHCNIGLMVGFPFETDEELDETIAWLDKNQASVHEVDSLSVFYIKPLSHVDQHPDRYGITFPSNPAARWNRWMGSDGSTYEARVARAHRLLNAIKKTSIKIQDCNIFGL